ncbi:MAG TPA: hypothetical protein VN317_06765 [Candidatus Methanoperedens sp.]|nr:hypothetical protein [Candidatus Methanoperedens sp.]
MNESSARVLDNLEALAACGEAAADFYQACADAWPKERDFWSDLAVDEVVQEARLRLMRPRARDSAETAKSVKLYPPAALNGFLAWVKASRDRVRTGDLDRRGALAIARDLERSPIMSEHFRVTRTTGHRIAHYLLGYATEFGEHERRIAARLASEPATARVA